jgi:hypothetical protein
MRVQDKKSLALAPPAAKRALSLLLFSLHVYLYTFLGQGFFLLGPFALGLYCTVQRIICICMDGSSGKNGLLLY